MQRNKDKYELYCDHLEKEYKQAKNDGLFEILKVLELDKKNSDSKIIKAVDYFNDNNGVVKSDAPLDFLSEREQEVVGQGENFRPELYCMLLSEKFSDAVQNKSVFLQHSFEYAFDS